MKQAAFLLANLAITLIMAVGLPLYYGYIGRGWLSPVIVVIAVVIYNVATGWRPHHAVGVIRSVVAGTFFASVVIFPFYWLGLWLGRD